MPRRAKRDAPSASGRDSHNPETSGASITIDGLEGDYARVELPDGTTEDRKVDRLPAGVKEGDVLRETDAGLEIDHKGTRSRKKKAQTKLDEVNEEEPAGEIRL